MMNDKKNIKTVWYLLTNNYYYNYYHNYYNRFTALWILFKTYLLIRSWKNNAMAWLGPKSPKYKLVTDLVNVITNKFLWTFPTRCFLLCIVDKDVRMKYLTTHIYRQHCN